MTQDILGSNLGDVLAGDDTPAPPLKAAPAEERVRIILEENDGIPPTGQFFGVNGKGYILRPGEAADVPVSLIEILNNAVMSVPIKDAGDRVSGYRDKLRFPYRVLSGFRAQSAA